MRRNRKLIKKQQQDHWELFGVGLDPPASNPDDLDSFSLSGDVEFEYSWGFINSGDYDE